VTSTVAGSEIYEVRVTIKPLKEDDWNQIKEQCSGQVASMLDLLAGKLGDGVLKILCNPESGLFPKPKEIRFSCTCPDHADMCKHVAATLYGVGVKLDTQPDLFFVLRSVDPIELLSSSTVEISASPDPSLAEEDLSALFGIEIEAEPVVIESITEKARKTKTKVGRTKRSTSGK